VEVGPYRSKMLCCSQTLSAASSVFTVLVVNARGPSGEYPSFMLKVKTFSMIAAEATDTLHQWVTKLKSSHHL
jgi:hypothetical protein